MSYNIHDIINSIEEEYIEHLLFCHAFTSCDTTAHLHNFGKKSILSKLKMSKDLQLLSKKFLPKQCHSQWNRKWNILIFWITSFVIFQLATNNNAELLYHGCFQLILCFCHHLQGQHSFMASRFTTKLLFGKIWATSINNHCNGDEKLKTQITLP